MSNSNQTIALGSDHAGFSMKEHIQSELHIRGFQWEDLGTFSSDSVDYPLYAGRVAQAISTGKYTRGILICGTGIGVSMAANRFQGVRAALCMSEEMAKLSRHHNDSNILVLGGRLISEQEASKILQCWLEEKFQGGRHAKRIELLETLTTMKDLYQ